MSTSKLRAKPIVIERQGSFERSTSPRIFWYRQPLSYATNMSLPKTLAVARTRYERRFLSNNA